MSALDRPLSRRQLLTASAGVSVLGALAACSVQGSASSSASDGAASAGATDAPATLAGTRRGVYPRLQSRPPAVTGAVLAKPGSLLTALPTTGTEIALTIDDGVDSDVVAAYLDLAAQTGIRLTFFVTAGYPSWSANAAALRPLVDSGQVQLGNHTWSHPSLPKLGAAQVVAELTRCETFLNNTFGVTAKPYLRPPYGYHTAASRSACASAGFTTNVLWEGSFGDSGPISDADLMRNGVQWLTARRIVIGHANVPTVTRHYGEIIDLLRARSLVAVTLDDVWRLGAGGGPRARAATPDPTYPSASLVPTQTGIPTP